MLFWRRCQKHSQANCSQSLAFFTYDEAGASRPFGRNKGWEETDTYRRRLRDRAMAARAMPPNNSAIEDGSGTTVFASVPVTSRSSKFGLKLLPELPVPNLPPSVIVVNSEYFRDDKITEKDAFVEPASFVFVSVRSLPWIEKVKECLSLWPCLKLVSWEPSSVHEEVSDRVLISKNWMVPDRETAAT